MLNLDLAFEVDCKEYSEEPWTNLIQGPDLWLHLFSHWLRDLETDLFSDSYIETYTLGLRLVNDTEIRLLNKVWRGMDQSTDVLSFPIHECLLLDLIGKDNNKKNISIELGDIIISIDTAARQATEHKYRLEEELHWLASHGMLHLIGFDHPDQKSLNRMLNYQEKLLSKRYHDNSKN
ncbi:predicted metal-dependent hydrolase (chromatophore) [Paulinella micropora]|uniref:Predicted metal-dependent hydrolase n=1 Tax=Paulinella micropora TaxID=1928728 RepID=A0A1L5YBP3_9EUKA|nr:hypothetical protein PCKR_338 [Paulinella micropora]AQX44892.1 hypothetical protein PFK_338 [Paulinella micropora]BBL86106.1 predicted metal-dependent hydrolase [Paulinella micropora]